MITLRNKLYESLLDDEEELINNDDNNIVLNSLGSDSDFFKIYSTDALKKNIYS